MILRGQIFKDQQLLFESEIEKATKRNRKTDKRQKRDKETLNKNPQPYLLFPLTFFRRKATEEQAPLPRITFEYYAMQ